MVDPMIQRRETEVFVIIELFDKASQDQKSPEHDCKCEIQDRRLLFLCLAFDLSLSPVEASPGVTAIFATASNC
jgi:hypothetical protein